MFSTAAIPFVNESCARLVKVAEESPPRPTAAEMEKAGFAVFESTREGGGGTGGGGEGGRGEGGGGLGGAVHVAAPAPLNVPSPQGVHDDEPATLELPAEHGVHTPSLPAVAAVPATYTLDRYAPAAQDCRAVATALLAAVVQARDTYWPVPGAVHEATGHVGLVPALVPDPV